MKILPFAMYIKNQVEEVECIDCGNPYIFSRVNYDRQTLKEGGCVHAFAKCVSCREETEIVVEIDPVEEELIEGVADENVYKTIFFTDKKRNSSL